jgi:hypothetical protein
MVFGRVAGISLLVLGWAGWPGINASRSITTLLNYSLLVAVYLGYVGFVGRLDRVRLLGRGAARLLPIPIQVDDQYSCFPFSLTV